MAIYGRRGTSPLGKRMAVLCPCFKPAMYMRPPSAAARASSGATDCQVGTTMATAGAEKEEEALAASNVLVDGSALAIEAAAGVHPIWGVGQGGVGGGVERGVEAELASARVSGVVPTLVVLAGVRGSCRQRGGGAKVVSRPATRKKLVPRTWKGADEWGVRVGLRLGMGERVVPATRRAVVPRTIEVKSWSLKNMLREEVSVICSECVISVLWQPPRSWAGVASAWLPVGRARSSAPSGTWPGERGAPSTGRYPGKSS